MFFKAFMLGVDVCKRVVETGRTVMFVRLAYIHVVQSCPFPDLYKCVCIRLVWINRCVEKTGGSGRVGLCIHSQ